MPDTVDSSLSIDQAAQKILKHAANDLQVIPAVALKLLRLTSEEDTNVADLSQLIETEPSLAAKVLRNVNSAAFALSHKVTSIKRAVNILGFSSVRQTALNQLFYNKLIQHKSKQQFDQLFFWQHCLFVASLSRAIAQALKHDDPDLIYSAGLMHDIGKIVLETHGKVSYSDFILANKNDEQATTKSEHDFFGINHNEIGWVFCQHWNIPERISAVIYCHHDFPDANNELATYQQDIAIVSFADYIAWIHGIGSIVSNNPPDLAPEALHHLNLEKLDIELLLNHVDQEMQKTREFYGIQFPSLYKLRATLVQTTLLLNRHNQAAPSPTREFPKNLSISSLTTPHKSLLTDEIVPWTLAAIQQDFNFERLIMLNINSKQRSLVTTYSLPEAHSTQELQHFNIKIETLSRPILNSLRERKAVIINAQDNNNHAILAQFKVEEFLLVPILSQNRLVALLYADNPMHKQAISPERINEITPITHELGIALNNAKQFELEKTRAELDPLTGLMNKRMVTQFLERSFKLPKEKLNQVAVGFIDIDFFKKFNDSCGHQAGDDALKIVAQIMRTLTRPQDFIGRYGGEEFVFALLETNQQGAASYAERIRQEIERKGKILSQRFQGHALTVSIGVSMYQADFTSYEKIIEAADIAMYQSKQQGRNRITVV